MATSQQKAYDKEMVALANKWLHLHYRVGDYIVVEEGWEDYGTYQIKKINDIQIERGGLFTNYRVWDGGFQTVNLENGREHSIKLEYDRVREAARNNWSGYKCRVISKAELMNRLSEHLDWKKSQVSLKNGGSSSMEQVAAARRRTIEEEGRSVSDSALNNIITSLRQIK